MVCRINDHFQERGLQITVPEKKKKKKKINITSSACLYKEHSRNTPLGKLMGDLINSQKKIPS